MILSKWQREKQRNLKKGKMRWRVPFEKGTGNLLFYPLKTTRYEASTGKIRYNTYSFEWANCFEFEDELEIAEFVFNSRSAYFLMRSTTTNKTYPMFPKDLTKLFKYVTVNCGKVKFTWTFVKKGLCYGIIPIYKTPALSESSGETSPEVS